MIKVFIGSGGGGGAQEGLFAGAKAKIMADYSDDKDYDVSFDCKSVKYVNESRWTEEDFLNWASEGNIFLSLAHFHQGVGSTLAWSVEEIWRQFSKLESVIHYPSKKMFSIFARQSSVFKSSG